MLKGLLRRPRPGSAPPSTGCKAQCCGAGGAAGGGGLGAPSAGKPVDLSAGIEILSETDIALRGARGKIEIVRTYRTLRPAAGPFGTGTSHNYSFQLDTFQPQSAALVNLVMPDGNRFAFVRQADGTWVNDTIPAMRGAVMTSTVTDPLGRTATEGRGDLGHLQRVRPGHDGDRSARPCDPLHLGRESPGTP